MLVFPFAADFCLSLPSLLAPRLLKGPGSTDTIRIMVGASLAGALLVVGIRKYSPT